VSYEGDPQTQLPNSGSKVPHANKIQLKQAVNALLRKFTIIDTQPPMGLDGKAA
jgi:hypothetical protein